MSETRAMDEQFDNDIFSAGLDAPADEGEVVSQGLTSNKAEDQTPGQILREARLAQDATVADLCGLTMLSKHTVEALEDDDFEALAQPVFVRGYYRKCAKVLEIDAEPLLAAYTASGGAGVAAASQQSVGGSGAPFKVMPADVTPRKSRPFGFVLLLLILIIAVIAGYVYWSDSLDRIMDNGAGSADISLSSAFDSLQTESGTEQATTAADDESGISVLPDILAADEKADAAAGRDNAGQIGEASNAAATSAAAAATDTATDAAAPQAADNTQTAVTLPVASAAAQQGAPEQVTATAQVAAGEEAGAETAAVTNISNASNTGTASGGTAVAATALTIKFNDRSWVNIHDASGKQLLVGIYENTTRMLDGEPPYRLVIGYAPGVAVSYNGQVVDFDMAGNHTARFTVGTDNG